MATQVQTGGRQVNSDRVGSVKAGEVEAVDTTITKFDDRITLRGNGWAKIINIVALASGENIVALTSFASCSGLAMSMGRTSSNSAPLSI
jgi:hypothetical protein